MKLIIHNFYGRFSPSGENELVRNGKAEFALRHFKFSDALYKSNSIRKLWAIVFRKNNALKRLIAENKEDLTTIEIHNTFPMIGLMFIRKIPKNIKVVLYLHNFRLSAPCGVLMTPQAESCNVCLENGAKGLVKSVSRACYRNSRALTIYIQILNFVYRVSGVFSRVDEIVTFSNYHASSVRDHSREDVNVRIVENTVTYLSGLKRRIESREDSVVYMGRLSAEKGIVKLMEAWADIPTLPTLLVYGAGPQRETVESLASEAKNIEYRGFADLDEKRRIFNICSAIIIPSICAEGYPITLAEAKSVGIPVLINNVEPLVSHCSGLKHQVIDVNNIDAFRLLEFLRNVE